MEFVFIGSYTLGHLNSCCSYPLKLTHLYRTFWSKNAITYSGIPLPLGPCDVLGGLRATESSTIFYKTMASVLLIAWWSHQVHLQYADNITDSLRLIGWIIPVSDSFIVPFLLHRIEGIKGSIELSRRWRKLHWYDTV